MATTLTLISGTVTASLSAANDSKAQEVLRQFVLATGGSDAWSNQQKVNHVVQTLRAHMISTARQRYIGQQRQAVEDSAASTLDF